MPDYRLAVGTNDPYGFSAATEQDATRHAVDHIERHLADEVERNPQEALTLLGPSGPVTRPSERVDEFVRRVPGAHPGIDSDTFQPGETNAPGCNGG